MNENKGGAACNVRTTYYAGSECGQEAVYRVYADGMCFTCDRGGYNACNGHRVCAEHAYTLRKTATRQRLSEELPPFIVGRIHSLALAGDAS